MAFGIVGAACRLPGASNEAAFRQVLNEGRFTVSTGPQGRWQGGRLYHPGRDAKGAAYTFAGGYLDAPFDFDMAVFGMSPREAEQVDPQQRLLAELVWEALEDARIAPESIAGSETGVYIGVSALDHANLFAGDPAAIESHFMTGNTLSIVANRISYLFDLKGPSFVVDTACSSSLVAVDRALADLRAGRIDTAIVGGVNMLLSPASFVGFSRAQMLSPTGACRPFSALADGYVRSEGGVVFVLRRAKDAIAGSIRAHIVASAVNSDGRTAGIALPGPEGQRAMLERAYRDAGICADALSFVEAHGTGTPVGDPVEAMAIGEVLGRARAQPLPIGSVKSNIGHLEPASGAAGMMKALIALEQRELPATLHLGRLNPDIDFAGLNLLPASVSLPLEGEVLHCGVSSFGFGGTNAHVVLRSADAVPAASAVPDAEAPRVLTISAQCEQALAELASAYAAHIASGCVPRELARSTAHARARMPRRLALPVQHPDAMVRALTAFSSGQNAAEWQDVIEAGHALGGPVRTCFVYSGNGGQWAGMGQEAYRLNPDFRRAFDEAAEHFREQGIGPLANLMFAEDLEDRLQCAAVAQPLIFAVQAGLTGALAASGILPDCVTGHSVGEIAAAWAAGAIDMAQAVRILAARARSQERLRGQGAMMAFAASKAAIEALLDQAGLPDIGIAAENAVNSITVSGSRASVAAFHKLARAKRMAGRALDVTYPYHSAMLDPIEDAFRRQLGRTVSGPCSVPFYSTVVAARHAGRLDTGYWWRNLRETVRFRETLREIAADGANFFIEIGARSVLSGNVGAEMDAAGHSARCVHTLDGRLRGQDGADPIARITARLAANGFETAVNCREPGAIDRSLDLPGYPWQRRTLQYRPTPAAVDLHGFRPAHPLIGSRLLDGSCEWSNVLDAARVGYLADHVVGGEVLLPATALAEMALAAAREELGSGGHAVEAFDIVQPMVLSRGAQLDVRTRYDALSAAVTVHSRPRLSDGAWTLHAKGRIAAAARMQPPSAPDLGGARWKTAATDIYRQARRSGIDYGPSFRLLRTVRRHGNDLIETRLVAPAAAGSSALMAGHVLHPASLDAAFHGLFDLVRPDDPAPQTWLPVRFGKLSVWREAAIVTAATIRIERDNAGFKTVQLWLKDENGEVAAHLDGALLRALPQSQDDPERDVGRLEMLPAGLGEVSAIAARVRNFLADRPVPQLPDGWLLLRMHMRAALRDALAGQADAAGSIDLYAPAPPRPSQHGAPDLLDALMDEAAEAGLLVFEDGARRAPFSFCPDCDLPPADAILSAFIETCPAASADIALSALAAREVPALLGQGRCWQPRSVLLEQHASTALRHVPLVGIVTDLMDELAAHSPIHVLLEESGGHCLLEPLAAMAQQGRIRLSILPTDRISHDRLRGKLAACRGVAIAEPSGDAVRDVDIALGVEGQGAAPVSATRLRLAPGGAVLRFTLARDPLAAFQTATVLPGAACPDADSFASWGGAGDWLSARIFTGRAIEADQAGPMAVETRFAGAMVEIAALLGQDGECADKSVAARIWLADEAGSTGAKDMAEHVGALGRWLVEVAASGCDTPVWIAVRGPRLAGALRGFFRVACNELGALDLRFAEIAPDLAQREAADRLRGIIGSCGDEREWRFDRGGAAVARFCAGLGPVLPDGDAGGARLVLKQPGLIEAFAWEQANPAVPGPGEVAIRITATGLNFRDVMLAVGALDDDVLQDGLAGAVFGMECAGRIEALGSGVTGFSVGDEVFGFAQDCFATHARARADGLAVLPEGMTAKAAAALPVAFVTAWYSLIELARLSNGESVLIHGGAGGVGLAAIQIAKGAGARVIATVSSPDKEALARHYGADHVLNSRTLDFADIVQREMGGVDVVLNSLAGEAMRASLQCLKPRGRFIELGKRDYVANTALNLRPFRSNLSYHGVDLDQLLLEDGDIARRAFEALLEGLAAGRYLPLPVSSYPGYVAAGAFRLMQSGGHLGKIVITPDETARPEMPARYTPGKGTHLVVGGTRGFGLATAQWLRDRGARRVVIASRSGPADALPDERIEFAPLDVTDLEQVRDLVTRIAGEPHGLEGVWHTAVELQDGLIENIDRAALARVFDAKVQGARNLDLATRAIAVERFVLFSSVSALIGNPGQGAYAAANGYLEGLCRERRTAGLPGLAVMWGAITDTGLLAEKQDILASLDRVAGVHGMTAAQALERLGRILPLEAGLADPVVVCARLAQGSGLAALRIAETPLFAGRFSQHQPQGEAAGLGLGERIAGKDEGDAIRIVLDVLKREVAAILRLSEQEVDPDRSIDSLGMDSLMALELRMTLETRHGVELPMMAVTAVGSLRELAARLVGLLTAPDEPPGERGASAAGLSEVETVLVAMHGGPDAVPAPRDQKMQAVHG